MNELDKELVHVIHHTLQSALSPDKTLIDQAQQELKVLQFRQGTYPHNETHRINSNPLY